MIGIDFTGIIYASPGVLKHINRGMESNLIQSLMIPS